MRLSLSDPQRGLGLTPCNPDAIKISGYEIENHPPLLPLFSKQLRSESIIDFSICIYVIIFIKAGLVYCWVEGPWRRSGKFPGLGTISIILLKIT